MIIDTSVLMAILQDEPEASRAYAHLGAVDDISISAGTMIECISITRARFGTHGLSQLDTVLEAGRIAVVPVTESQVDIIRDAFPKYGKGQKNKAQLNFGDLFAYALAKETGETLFFKGNDFTYTDLKLLRLDG